MYSTAGASIPRRWTHRHDWTGTKSAAVLGHAREVKIGADAICTILNTEHLLNMAGLQPSKCHRGKIPWEHFLLVSKGAAASFRWSRASLPQWTTRCHVFPISIVACLYFWSQFRLIKDSLKLVLYTSLFILFAVGLKMRPHQAKLFLLPFVQQL